ncbi:YeeE/YedE thiosulfate transporter family protein [Desulfosporosinus nitroreducens]|uniref:YeeE/YedE family protein n=1 Tax=Desulfosporosinus nitroreducens TaxID=2018668 RepID=A0ABT8QQ19_9FIRM|nr:YeeE/YedE thiosulfate transporter family protein [Desulfosporosinus nitroreducens]MDO0823449.1 YeeE/YedE family protein [Desulfosporosinus nitroreducens]
MSINSVFHSQRKWNIGFILFLTLLLLLLSQISIRLTLITSLGISLGFVLQKSRFCLVSALRDPILIGMTQLTRAFLLLLGISILGFALVSWGASQSNIPLSLNIFPMGVHTVVGGLLFGIGMVLAGGCSTGIIIRIGEGFAMQMLAFFGLAVGSVLGERSLKSWRYTFGEWPGIFLPDIFGWVPTLILEIIVLLTLWQLARWWQKKQLGE